MKEKEVNFKKNQRRPVKLVEGEKKGERNVENVPELNGGRKF